MTARQRIRTHTEATAQQSRPALSPNAMSAHAGESTFAREPGGALSNQDWMRLLGVRAKLTIGDPGDADEQAADRAADDFASGRAGAAHVARKCATCSDDGGTLARAAAGSAGFASGHSPANALGALSGNGGTALPHAARESYERHFGADLSRVRIHTGDTASAAARTFNARAFTLGQNIYFGSGEYGLHDTPSRKLLTHELAHTLQQGGESGPARGIRAKLAVSEPGDREEVEADRAADAIVSGHPAPSIQRKCAPGASDGKCDDDRKVMRKPTTGPSVDHGSHDAAAALGNGGEPLSADVRSEFEPRFGRDFSQVRVHSGAEATRGALAIGARAYTRGDDIAFASGEYAPGTGAGRLLLAHELTHVVQQRAGLKLKSQLGPRGDSHERTADAVAERVVAGRSARDLLNITAPLAPTVQRDEPDRSHETKSEFAARVLDRAADRLNRNIGVLSKWSGYVREMEAFQLKAELLTGMVTEYATVAAGSPSGRARFERFGGTHEGAERRFEGSMLDIQATYQNRVGAFIGFLDSRTGGHWTSPSVAEKLQVIAGDRSTESLPKPVHVGPDYRYQYYAPTIQKMHEGKIGGCQFCHEINWAWQQTAKQFGDPLPRDLAFSPLLDEPLPGSADLSAPDNRAALMQFIGAESGTATPDATSTALPSVSTTATGAPAATPANPFVPTMALPEAVELPPPRTDLCGAVPSAEDSDRTPSLASWGPASAVIADVIARVDSVLVPLGPRGYHVLGRQEFDALYAMTPRSILRLRDDIIGRIAKRQDDYRALIGEIRAGDTPYEEFCPIVDELLPSTNAGVRQLALMDVKRWQQRERDLAILELVLIGLSFIIPPLGVAVAGVALGLSRISLGLDQQRQGRQWTRGSHAGLYSLQQEAEAPDLAERGKSNVNWGAFAVVTSALPLLVSGLRGLQSLRANAQLMRALEGGAIIRDARYPGIVLAGKGGRLLVMTEAGEVLAYGTIKDGRFFLTNLSVPYSPAAGGAAGEGGALVPYGSNLATPGGGGNSALVPRGPFLFGYRPQQLLLGSGRSVPSSWISTPQFNALQPHQLPTIGGTGSSARWVRLPDGSWAPEFAGGAGQGTRLITYGDGTSGGRASFIVEVPGESTTALVAPRTGNTYQGARSYPMQTAAMTDPATGVVGARSHLVPHADTPVGPLVSTAQGENYVSHLSHVYNERIRRTLEQRFRSAGHDWLAYNVTGTTPRLSTGGFAIPEAEVLIELNPNGSMRAWRFPNDPALYQNLPADFDTAIAPFEITNIPTTPVQ